MFENLDVYRRAVDLADRIITHTKDAPRGFGFLTDQLNRAALSISTLLGGVDRECRIAFDLEAAPDAPVAVGVRAGDVIPLSDRILVPAGAQSTLCGGIERGEEVGAGVFHAPIPCALDCQFEVM